MGVALIIVDMDVGEDDIEMKRKYLGMTEFLFHKEQVF